MTTARNGSKVKVHYTGRLVDGTLFDSSIGGDPIEFIIGNGDVISGLEQAIVGMNAGDSKETTISSDDAYGPYKEDRVLIVQKNDLPSNVNLQVGARLQAKQSDERIVNVIVKAVGEKSVTLDANHPLAGKDLIFKIDLLEVESLIN